MQKNIKTPEKIKKRIVIYGVTNRANDNLETQINDWMVDNSRISDKEKSLFFNSLKLLVLSGIRLSKTIVILADKAKNLRLERILRTINYDLNNGLSFSASLSKYPDVFTNSEIKMIYSAEITGKLKTVLAKITKQIQKNIELKMQIKSVMMYPITVFSAIFLAGIVIMTWVVPKFEKLFATFGGELPISTQILIGLSNFFQNFWWLVLAILITSYFLFKNWKNSPKGKYEWDKFLLQAPIIHSLMNNYQTIEVANNFATLLSSGLSVDKALKTLRKIIDNSVIAESIKNVENHIKSGKLLHQAFNEEPVFDKVLGEIIEVGEQSNSLDKILFTTAEQYQLEFDASIKNLTKLLEPVVLIIVALAVVFMAMAIMSPIFELQNSFSGS